MNKAFCFFLGLAFLESCGGNQLKVEKRLEDGVEVVLNHIEPYKLTNTSLNLRLEHEFSIDSEGENVVPNGFIDLDEFDVDSSGNIYCFHARESEITLVHKFDSKGRFVSSFGKRGQGPDAIQNPVFLGICIRDELWIQDYQRMVYVFDKIGTIVRRSPAGPRWAAQGMFVDYPLSSGNYLRFRDYWDPESYHRFDNLLLCNSSFETIAELGRCDYGPALRFSVGKARGTPRVFVFRVSGDKIYVGDEASGYEISVFDEYGTILRKIRKEYTAADAPREFLENLILNMGRYIDKVILPDKMPPFHYFFLDDEGRLYVKTYEPGPKTGEYIHDIFTPEGVLIARKSLPGHGAWMYPGRNLDTARARNGRLYCIREKDTGFKELAVYKIVWR